MKTLQNGFLIPTKNGFKLDRIVFGDYFLSKYHVYTVEKDSYIYDGGVYKCVSDNILKSLIEKELEARGTSNCNWVRECLEKIKLKTVRSLEEFQKIFDNNPNLINVKNGILDITNGEICFKKHSPRYLLTKQLDVKYNPKATLDKWNYYLDSSLDADDERSLLQEHLGYHYYHGLPAHHFYCFHGTGGNGKGLYFKIMRSILGGLNVSMERSTMLSENGKQNQFFGSKFIGKFSIQVPETSYYLNNMDYIKILSGGDTQQIELKRENASINYEFKGKLSISTNDKIKIRIDDGVERRITFIKMDNKPKKVNPFLYDELLQEIEGIFLWGLKGLLRFKNNGWKHTMPDSHFKLFNTYWVHSDNYLRFVRNFIQYGNGVSKGQLIQKFIEQFSGIHKNKLDIIDKVEEALRKEGYNVNICRGRVKSLFDDSFTNTYYYSGIEYVEYKESEKEYMKQEQEGKNESDLTAEKVFDLYNKLSVIDKGKFGVLFRKNKQAKIKDAGVTSPQKSNASNISSILF